jgi:hypothetical protein
MRLLFTLNSINGKGPCIVDQITPDLEENGKELSIARKKMNWEILGKTVALYGPLL